MSPWRDVPQPENVPSLSRSGFGAAAGASLLTSAGADVSTVGGVRSIAMPVVPGGATGAAASAGTDRLDGASAVEATARTWSARVEGSGDGVLTAFAGRAIVGGASPPRDAGATSATGSAMAGE